MNKKFYIDSLSIDKDTVLEFFFLFSRMEYALKRAGYHHRTKYQAKWDDFIKETGDGTKEYKDAKEFILATKLKKQTINGNREVVWEELTIEVQNDNKSLNDCIQVIRNNLFHGGKYMDGPVADYSRNQTLIKNAITVLNEWSHHDKIRSFFEPDF